MKKSILNKEAVENFRKDKKLQPFKIKQINHEIFKNQKIDFDDISTISNELKKDLKQKFVINSLNVDKILEDDQTTKIWFKTHDWYIIESVIIYHYKDKDKKSKKLSRITLCISSQVWCPVGCIFCVTWKLWIIRNLTYDEIISQLIFANNYIKNKLWKKEDWTLWKIRNVVFMWMWEPLLNYENMKKSIEIMLEQNCFSLSSRHVTISTCWIIKWIQKLIDDNINVKLAISLHSPIQSLREELIPIAKTNKLDELMKIIDRYVKHTNNRIFYEYIMIKWKTDTDKLALELSKLLKWKLAHLNLIPYNHNPAIDVVDLIESEDQQIHNFKNICEKKWITVTIRDSMWRSVESACWQLWYDKIKK